MFWFRAGFIKAVLSVLCIRKILLHHCTIAYGRIQQLFCTLGRVFLKDLRIKCEKYRKVAHPRCNRGTDVIESNIY